MEKIKLPRFTHKLAAGSLAEQLTKIDHAAKVWLLFEDSEPSWWSIFAGGGVREHPYDITDSGLTWAVWEYVGSHDHKSQEHTEENAVRLIDNLTESLSHAYDEDELPELLRD